MVKLIISLILVCLCSINSYADYSISRDVQKINLYLPNKFKIPTNIVVKYNHISIKNICESEVLEKVTFINSQTLNLPFNQESIENQSKCSRFFDLNEFQKNILFSFLKNYLTKNFNLDRPEILKAFHFKRSLLIQNTNNEFEIQNKDITNKLIEDISFNLIYFFLDSNYACKKPFIAKLLSREFNLNLISSCTKNYIVPINSSIHQYLANISPQRIYQIDYLLADKGSDASSSFGHSMFRLVICAPDRLDPFSGEKIKATNFGKECLNDQLYHLVISFRAEIKDLHMDYLKGVFGGYPSKLFILPLSQVQDEYTKKELRNLRFYSLNFNRGEIEDFIDRVVEEKYNYEGAYKFFTNNCATESLDLVKTIVKNQKVKEAFALTPFGVLNDLRPIINSTEYSEINSYSNAYQEVISSIFGINITPLNSRSLKSFFKSKVFISREMIVNQLVLNYERGLISKDIFRKRLSGLYMLEEVYQNMLKDDLKKEILKNRDQYILPNIDQNLMNANEIVISTESYGVPAINEVNYVLNVDNLREAKLNYNKKFLNEIENKYSSKFPHEFQELKKSEYLMKTIQEKIFKI